MNENTVITVQNYNKVDGRNAYHSDIEKITLGAPMLEENKSMQIAAQIWKKDENGEVKLYVELPIHQVFDLMIVLSRTMLHFREAYRFPLLYEEEKPMIERIGVQGGVMPVGVNVDNPNINEEIKFFSQSLSDLGELTGDRLRVLTRILEEMEYC